MSFFGDSSVLENEQEAIDIINANAVSLNGFHDLDPLFEKIGSARIVMLGEASHGTHEYYTWRTFITKRLIKEKGFNFIAVEGDWPDCYKINRYIKQDFEEGKKAAGLLQTFDRWPTWMWANWEISALAEWLQLHNQSLPKSQKAGFYGLDVYSLWESLDAIMKYLEKVDAAALEKASETFQCFAPYKEDGTSYAHASRLVPELCENEVLELLNEIQRKLPQYDSGAENVFSTEQNALVAVNAEKYYRAMIRGEAESWNVRDSHMQETLERLLDFHGSESKAIVWAHNTHIGDSSATDMADDGMYNIGELSRKKFPEETFLVGFGSYGGSVMAGNSWGAKMQHMIMPDAAKHSWENILHKTGKKNQLIFMDALQHSFLSQKRIGHRAIGVVYRPEYERRGNYVPSILPKRYDAFIYIDKTSALHPLHITPHGHHIPETYPFGV